LETTTPSGYSPELEVPAGFDEILQSGGEPRIDDTKIHEQQLKTAKLLLESNGQIVLKDEEDAVQFLKARGHNVSLPDTGPYKYPAVEPVNQKYANFEAKNVRWCVIPDLKAKPPQFRQGSDILRNLNMMTPLGPRA
jgi:hypothetical protein